MTEFRFHHLERRRVDQALPELLARAFADGRRAVVQTASEEQVAALNDRLWTFDDASFLPHGAAGDGDPAEQPIFLTSRLENPNGAKLLVVASGADAPVLGQGQDFEQAILLFDGRDEEALKRARADWVRLKAEGRDVSYWREGEEGGWERAR
jgi:DNA polymerase-3 subunit chi